MVETFFKENNEKQGHNIIISWLNQFSKKKRSESYLYIGQRQFLEIISLYHAGNISTMHVDRIQCLYIENEREIMDITSF